MAAIDLTENCDAELLPEEFNPSHIGIAMPLGSPYKPFFDEAYVILFNQNRICTVTEMRTAKIHKINVVKEACPNKAK